MSLILSLCSLETEQLTLLPISRSSSLPLNLCGVKVFRRKCNDIPGVHLGHKT